MSYVDIRRKCRMSMGGFSSGFGANVAIVVKGSRKQEKGSAREHSLQVIRVKALAYVSTSKGEREPFWKSSFYLDDLDVLGIFNFAMQSLSHPPTVM